MKTFEIEAVRVTYVFLTIEAPDKQIARDKAAAQLEADYYHDDGEWTISTIDDITGGTE